MRMMTWAWPVSVALAVGAGFVGGRNWERRHHGPDPFGPRGHRAGLGPDRLGPPEFQPGDPGRFPPPPYPPPHPPEQHYGDFHRHPGPGFPGGPPPYREYPPQHYPDQQGYRQPSQPVEPAAVVEQGPKLSAAEAARLQDLKELRSTVGSPLQKKEAGEQENAEANLMFEAALRSVIAEEMAKPATPPAEAVPPEKAPAAELPTNNAASPAAPDLSTPANPGAEPEPAASSEGSPPGLLSSEVKPTSGTVGENLLPAPELPASSAEELRSAARFLEQRAAEAEEVGAAERADKLRELAATLWRESRSSAKE